MRLAPPLPDRPCWSDHVAVEGADDTGQAILDELAEPVVGDQLGNLRAPRATLGIPLGDRGLVVQLIGPRGGVATQLARDRRRVTAEAAADLAGTELLGVQERNVLTFAERQVPARHCGRQAGSHAASVTEPPEPDRPGHACLDACLLGLHPAGDRRPEPDPVLTPSDRRASRRRDLPPIRTNLLLPSPVGHVATS